MTQLYYRRSFEPPTAVYKELGANVTFSICYSRVIDAHFCTYSEAVVYKKAVLKNITEKHLQWRPFLGPADNFTENRSSSCFPVNFAKFFKSAIQQDTCKQQLRDISDDYPL